jgi:hypothetical protein
MRDRNSVPRAMAMAYCRTDSGRPPFFVACRQAGAAGGAPWQELVVKLCHLPAALSLILSFVLLIIGVASHREPEE